MLLEKCRILDLSNEILLLITSYCDGKSLLSLTQTCHAFKNLCDDVSVVQGAFFRKLSEDPPAIPLHALKKWIGSDKQVLERHLVALGCADDLVSDAVTGLLLEKQRNIRIDEDKTILQACRYLPNLLVFGCNSDLRYGATALLKHITLKHLMRNSTSLPESVPDIDDWPDLESHQWLDMSPDLHSRIAFVFAVQSLKYKATEGNHFESQAEDHRDAFAVQVADELENEFDASDDRNLLPLLRQQALLFKAIGILALAVRTRLQVRQGERPKIPLLNGIPWINLDIEPPTPLWNDELGAHRSWATWLARHNTAACQPEALNFSGEWIGVYETGRKRRACDPMMVNIHFQATRLAEITRHVANEPDFDILRISAVNCVDAVGSFNLSGRMDSTTGRFNMTKHYAAGFSWPWEGAMTPFGFVGRWGLSGSQASGFFWLYKRSWCEPSTDSSGHVV